MAEELSCLGNYFANSISENRLKRRIRRSLPALATEYNRAEVDELVRRELRAKPRPLSGLVVGAGERPTEIESRFPGVRWLTTDVDMAYRPLLIADTLRLPIADASQDLVVAEMVLEHVMDISQAARELERVCKAGGLVLIKAPFCFPWHGVPTDFFRPRRPRLFLTFLRNADHSGTNTHWGYPCESVTGRHLGSLRRIDGDVGLVKKKK